MPPPGPSRPASASSPSTPAATGWWTGAPAWTPAPGRSRCGQVTSGWRSAQPPTGRSPVRWRTSPPRGGGSADERQPLAGAGVARVVEALGPALTPLLERQRFRRPRAFHRGSEPVVVDQADGLHRVGGGHVAVVERQQVVAVAGLSPGR